MVEELRIGLQGISRAMCDGSQSDAAGMAVMHTAVAVRVRPSQQIRRVTQVGEGDGLLSR